MFILTYSSNVWKWNETKQSKLQGEDGGYLRVASRTTSMGSVRNKDVYEGFGMAERMEGVLYGVEE